MILTAHQPVYLPWLGLFHKIALADRFVIFDGVQYLPKDWNNRNRIKTAAGAIWLTVPVLRKGHREMMIRDIEINNATRWQHKHWRSLVLNYRNAPHFARYADFFEDVYRREWTLLSDLNEHILRGMLGMLGINIELVRATDFDFQGRGSDLVLDMCRKLGATTYIFGALGRDYAKVEDFEASGIRVVFQDYRHPVYPQLHGAFVSHLSAVDALFNCGPDTLDVLMRDQETLAT